MGPCQPAPNARTESRLARSSARTSVSPWVASAAARPFAMSRTANTTRAPAPARARAVANPMPLLAPVTITVRPLMSGTSAISNVVIAYNVGGVHNAVNGNMAAMLQSCRNDSRTTTATCARRCSRRPSRPSGTTGSSRFHYATSPAGRASATAPPAATSVTARPCSPRSPTWATPASGDEITTAVKNAGDGFGARLAAVAASFVRFAADNAALLDLMMATGKADETGSVFGAPGRPYAVLTELVRHGHETGELRSGDPERLPLIILVTFQGIAALVSSGKIPPAQTDAYIADATALFVRGRPDGGAPLRAG